MQGTPHTSDHGILENIQNLVHEEQRLYQQAALSDDDRLRLGQIQVKLDQCWDWLRQRRALREFGLDPDGATVRPASIVESYEQ
jgi:hypothetical protein